MYEPFDHLAELVRIRRAWMSANLTAKAYMMTVEVASASLSHLLPEVARADHDTLLREVFFHPGSCT